MTETFLDFTEAGSWKFAIFKNKVNGDKNYVVRNDSRDIDLIPNSELESEVKKVVEDEVFWVTVSATSCNPNAQILIISEKEIDVSGIEPLTGVTIHVIFLTEYVSYPITKCGNTSPIGIKKVTAEVRQVGNLGCGVACTFCLIGCSYDGAGLVVCERDCHKQNIQYK
jgi:hypothetical protein